MKGYNLPSKGNSRLRPRPDFLSALAEGHASGSTGVWPSGRRGEDCTRRILGNPSGTLQLERSQPLPGFTSQPPSLSTARTVPSRGGWMGDPSSTPPHLQQPLEGLPSIFPFPVHTTFSLPCRQGAQESCKQMPSSWFDQPIPKTYEKSSLSSSPFFAESYPFYKPNT